VSQVAKPTGLYGRILARGMALGHRDFYRNTARVLDLKKEDKYLEIGFGSGLFIKKYASSVCAVAGLDYSRDMVALASRINRGLVRSGKAVFRQGSALSLPWPDDEFSVAIAIETFYFWPEPEICLKEILRVLSPRGRLVIEMAYSADDGLDHAKHVKKMNLRLYGGKEMEVLLGRAGFEEIVVDYYKALWIPLKGYVVPKGMIVKAMKG